jgi:hypothetical protein
VLFRKRDKGVPPHARSGDRGPIGGKEEPAFHLIDFSMMKKGTVLQRRGKTIKQFAVTVNTATRVVTSGDVVDKAVYDALVSAGAVEPAEYNASPNDDALAVPAPEAPVPGTPSEE